MAGKVAFITGAARGQGRSHAVRLAEEGADVIAVDVCADIDTVTPCYHLAREEELQHTAKLVEQQGRDVVTRRADVRDLDELQSAFDEGLSAFGRVDAVIANAGIASFSPTLEMDRDKWRDMIDVNLTGVYHSARVAVPSMIEAGNGGSVVFTSSIGGFKGIQHVGHYVSAKHGVVGLMRTLANELAPHHIRVNTVHPTNVDTDMIQNPGTYQLFAPGDPEPSVDKAVPGFRSLNAIPVPWVESSDVANAVLFLASDEARYITGATLPVDAGASIK